METSKKKERRKQIRTKDDEREISRVFAELRPLCTQLFELPGKYGQGSASLLDSLTTYVREAPVVGLQACLDYILFPLLHLLDLTTACRSSKNFALENGLRRDGSPFLISDKVGEGVLSCLEAVLLRCSLASTDQMVMLLRKLTAGALLSPSEAAEEFRHGIIKCLRAVLLGLNPCTDESCTCKLIYGSPFFISEIGFLWNWVHAQRHSQTEAVSNEGCLIAFLQSEDASAAVGHLLSLLLQIAEAEASRGHKGSGKLRTDALSTLRILIAKVGTADALAFFLPGVASGLAKILRASRSVTSGAAGSIGALEQAVKGLAEILMLTFADHKNVAEFHIDCRSGSLPSKRKSAESALEALRCLSVQGQKNLQVAKDVPGHYGFHSKEFLNVEDWQQDKKTVNENWGCKEGTEGSCFRVDRNKEWLEHTAARVDSLLSMTFPILCSHPARVVRLGIAEATRGLLTMCSNTLRRSKPMLLECLFALACDDWGSVASVAYGCLSVLFSSNGKYLEKNELREVFGRLIDRLPKAILRGDETVALIHARSLAAAMYFAGPQGVSCYLFHSPAAISRFLDVMTQSMSHSTAFTGPMEQLILPKTNSVGYVHAISELNSDITMKENESSMSKPSSMYEDAQILQLQESTVSKPLNNATVADQLPHMPPWFTRGHKLYQVLAVIIRLAGFCAANGRRDEVCLSTLIEIPLETLRHTISQLNSKEQREEDWHSWYRRHGSGHLLRDAATASCVLNEIIFGASGRSSDTYASLFESFKRLQEQHPERMAGTSDEDYSALSNDFSSSFLNPLEKWEMDPGTRLSQHVIEAIGNILHEYTSSEIWDIPIDFHSPGMAQGIENQELPWHFFQDTGMLQQVIIEGVGVFGVSLGKDFETSGFLYSSLYLLLEKLTCSNYRIQRAADAAIRMFSASAGYCSVKDLVLANADYIIDSLCRQLRHLTINPHAPNLLAAVLSYIGAAHDILPLLEEPMRSISLELEVLARYQHPNLTVPILKALREILKASRQEAHSIKQEALEHHSHIKLEIENLKERDIKRPSEFSKVSSDVSFGSHNKDGDTFHCTDCTKETKEEAIINDVSTENWEKVLLALDEKKRYWKSVGAVVGSCLTASTPLLGSKQQEACLIGLDVIENGIASFALIEDAVKKERESREEIEWVARRFNLYNIQDIVNSVYEMGNDGNKLLPAMNKVWPYMVACLKHKKPSVVVRCLGAIANVIHECGGDFFIRRFYTDRSHFFRLLSARPCLSRSELLAEKSILLPFRKSSKAAEEEDMAQGSLTKVQEAVFKMISAIAKHKKSAPALETVFRQIAGMAVGFACASQALQEAATDALLSLSCIDPDVVWLLLADLAYSVHDKQAPSPPGPEFPELSQLLPPHKSPKEYLWVQFAGQDYSLNIDFSQAHNLLEKIDSCHGQVDAA